MVRTKSPAAVILDVQMPGGGGLSALSKIKSDPKTSKLPVMMLTGERDAETVMQAMDGGADDYMVKPFHPDMLLERLSRLVSKAKMPPRCGSFKEASTRAGRPAVAQNRPAPDPRPARAAGTGVKP